uniref:NADH dehydrogenase [ubiquinone] 1 alpha subcomplex subunit 12 n=1 Tax=Rhabditophanes sp. KR3021 TaxID=114890 RepID=A0AC35TPQ9_9BILA
MGLIELIGLDKLQKLASLVKQNGGIVGTLKRRYLMDVTRGGVCVGEDNFGNKYYEDNTHFMPRNRYVIFPDRVWLDYDATQIPPEWHRWLHHIGNENPTTDPLEKPKWGLEHAENLSIIEKERYIPYSTVRTKIQSWKPKN